MTKFLNPLATSYLMILLIITSCGYFEKDGTEIEVPITGKIMLWKQQGSDETILVLKETSEKSAGILEDCDSVFYDRNQQIIWAKRILNDYNSLYYQIKVVDSLGTTVGSATRKKEISRKDFVLQTGQRVPLWIRSTK